MRRKRARSKNGASIIMVALIAVALIALLYGAFQYFIVMGGSREVRNAVDAAALNVSKRVVEIKVPANEFCNDVADSTGGISATNINRVWGKACLINANAQAMQAEGTAGSMSSGNASRAYEQAQNMNMQLHTQIMDKCKLDQYFNQIAANRPAKMLGSDATAQTSAQSSWAAALVDRGAESNLVTDQRQFPKGVNVAMLPIGKKMYIKGYHPIRVNNRTFCFTVYRTGEMPHLISDSYFENNRADRNPVEGSVMPIPNAFKQSGTASSNRASLQASACAVVNPQVRYTMAIPYSYITIRFENEAKWYVEGKLVKSTMYESQPKFYPEVIKNFKLKTGGYLIGNGNLGNEYKAGNLWQGLNALPADHAPALERMVQRIQEIKPSFGMSELKQLLQKQNYKEAVMKYYIYPVYSSADKTDPSIEIAPDNGTLPGWLAKVDADGSEAQVVSENAQKDDPNTNTDYIFGGPSVTGKHWTECSGLLGWTPGTGFGQCLGELRVARLTKLYFTGLP